MQYVCNDSHEHFKTYNQQEKMKLHEILSNFHIGHDQNVATVQQLRAKQEITTICQNQPHSIFYALEELARQIQTAQTRHEKTEVKMHYNIQLITPSMGAWITRKRTHKMASHTQFQT